MTFKNSRNKWFWDPENFSLFRFQSVLCSIQMWRFLKEFDHIVIKIGERADSSVILNNRGSPRQQLLFRHSDNFCLMMRHLINIFRQPEWLRSFGSDKFFPAPYFILFRLWNLDSFYENALKANTLSQLVLLQVNIDEM